MKYIQYEFLTLDPAPFSNGGHSDDISREFEPPLDTGKLLRTGEITSLPTRQM